MAKDALSHRRSLVVLRVGGAAFVVVGLLMAIAGWVVLRADREISTRGTQIEAEVVDKTAVSGTDGDTDFLVEYRWRISDGREIVDERPVGRSQWESLAVGDAIAIRYLESDPERSLPVGTGTSVGLAAFVTVVGLLLAAIGVLSLLARTTDVAESSDSPVD